MIPLIWVVTNICYLIPSPANFQLCAVYLNQRMV